MRFAPILLTFLLASCVVASTEDARLAVLRLAQGPKDEFVNGILKLQSESGSSPQGVELEQLGEKLANLREALRPCLDAFGAVRDQFGAVGDACGMAAQDLFNLDNISELLNVCDSPSVANCTQAARGLVAVAQPALGMCVDAVNNATGGFLENIANLFNRNLDDFSLSFLGDAVDDGLLEQVVCQDGSALQCTADLRGFIDGGNVVNAVQCLREFADQSTACSPECQSVAETFSRDLGCCATGLVYSLNLDNFLMNRNITAEELTVCGVQLFTCQELRQLFDSNQLADVPLPLQVVPVATNAEPSDTQPADGQPDAGQPDAGQNAENGVDNAEGGNGASAPVVASGLTVLLVGAVAVLL